MLILRNAGPLGRAFSRFELTRDEAGGDTSVDVFQDGKRVANVVLTNSQLYALAHGGDYLKQLPLIEGSL